MSAPLPMLVSPGVATKLAIAVVNHIPVNSRESLCNYVMYGVPTGSFLLAVLSNNLAEACSRADEHNKHRLFDYVFVLYNFCPIECWGSPENVRGWMARGAELRRQHAEKEADREQ